jgi:hypothetical protein
MALWQISLLLYIDRHSPFPKSKGFVGSVTTRPHFSLLFYPPTSCAQ